MDHKTITRLRGWMQRYGPGGTLLAGGYVVMHALRTRYRRALLLAAAGLTGLGALLCLVPERKVLSGVPAVHHSPMRPGSATDWNSLLLEAVKHNDLHGVKTALAAISAHPQPGEERFDPELLQQAAADGSHEIIRLLVAHGADIEDYDAESTPMAEAARHHRKDTIALLMALGAHINADARGSRQTPLLVAIEENDLEMVRFLVARGAKVNVKDDNDWALQSAAQSPAIVRFLLEHGARVNVCGTAEYTPLMYAADWGCTESVRLLLAYGAHADHIARGGKTALILAAAKGHLAITRLLLQSGADVDRHGENQTTGEPGETALQAAERSGHDEIARLLRRAGAHR